MQVIMHLITWRWRNGEHLSKKRLIKQSSLSHKNVQNTAINLCLVSTIWIPLCVHSSAPQNQSDCIRELICRYIYGFLKKFFFDLLKVRRNFIPVYDFPVIAWLESQFLGTRTRLESRCEKWWLESTRVTFFTEWLDSTQVTVYDSRLESESFLQNLWVPDGQTQFACTQRNEHFLLQWWSRLAKILCFACLAEMGGLWIFSVRVQSRKLNNFQSRKELYKWCDRDNSLHETFRNASVTRPPKPAAQPRWPLTRPIECRPVGGRRSC